MLAEKETRDVIDVSDIDQINLSDIQIDDRILRKINKFADGDYSFARRKELTDAIFALSEKFQGLEELGKALSLLKTDKTRMFFLRKTKFSNYFCKDMIPFLSNHNIIEVLVGREYDFDLCKIAILHLHGDQKSLIKVINRGHGSDESFDSKTANYALFEESLPYLSYQTIVMGLDFWEEIVSLSDTEISSLPEEVIIYMIRKSSYKKCHCVHIDGLYNEDYLKEICEKVDDNYYKEYSEERIEYLNSE